MTYYWPASLPQAPRYGGYTEAPRSNVVSFQPEVGAQIHRRRSTVRVREISMSFQMTGDQVAIFERWFQEELMDGVNRFQWIDPRTQTDRTWLFSIPPNDAPYKLAPAADRAHDLWDVSFTVTQLA